MTSLDRRASLLGAIDHVVRHGIAGDIVECGVWRGGSMMLAALALMARGDTSRDLWLYDTFEGMSEPGGRGPRARAASRPRRSSRARRAARACGARPASPTCSANLESTGYPRERIHFVEGKVEDTIPATLPERMALLRLDTDWYESTRHELHHLYPLLSRHGILVIDDYGHWRGRAPGGRRVLRRAGGSRSTCTASTTPRGSWSSTTAHDRSGNPPPPRLLTAPAAGLRGGGGAAGCCRSLVLPLVATRVGAAEFGRLGFILVWARLAGDAGRGRLPRRGDAARGRPPTPRALAAARSRCSAPASRSRCRRCCSRSSPCSWAGPGRAAARRCARHRRAGLRPRLAGHLVPAGDAAAQPLVARSRCVVYAALIAGCWALRDQRARVRRPSSSPLSALLARARLALAAPPTSPKPRRARPLFDRPRSPRPRLGWKMLPVSIAGAAYSLALPAAASAQLSKPELGVYFMADRLVRAVLAVADPVYSLVYPRIVALFETQRARRRSVRGRWAAARQRRRGGAVLAGAVASGRARAAVLAAAPAASTCSSARRRLRPRVALAAAPRLEVHRLLDARQRPPRQRLSRTCIVVGGIVGVDRRRRPSAARTARHGLAWTAIGVELLVIVVAVAAMAASRARSA